MGTEANRQVLTKEERLRRRKRRRMKAYLARTVAAVIVILLLLTVFGIAKAVTGLVKDLSKEEEAQIQETFQNEEIVLPKYTRAPFYTEDFLPVNEYSRPGENLPEVKNIFVHYTANAGTTAAQTRSYFGTLAETGERSASTHFVIGMEGEIIQCLPFNEIGYAVIQRNYDSISIECCHPDANGEFTQATYDSLISLLAWLCGKYELSPQDILRHYDEGRKLCPLYYVENEEEWFQLKKDVETYIEVNGTEKTEDRSQIWQSGL